MQKTFNNYLKLKYVTAFVAAVLMLIALTVYLSFDRIENSPVDTTSKIYTLKEGATARTVTEDLCSNFIDRKIASVWLHLHPELTRIQKGEYSVEGKSVRKILEDMKNGNVIVKSYPMFSLVEGTNFAKIMRKISSKIGKIKDDEFFSLIGNKNRFLRHVLKDHEELLELIGSDVDNLEGLLHPASYPMYEKSPLMQMFSKAIITQLKILKSEWENRDKSEHITSPYEALIMASIIEKETFLDEERDQIAAVFENRLDKKMRLQTDPAVMYGVGALFTGKLTKAHLKADTPYNTYTRDGLPPTPICMPRTESIHAVMHPADSKALYFVAKSHSPKDGHDFSASLKEHNQAVANYRKKVREYLQSVQDEENKEDNEDTANSSDDGKNEKDTDKDKSAMNITDSEQEEDEVLEISVNDGTSEVSEPSVKSADGSETRHLSKKSAPEHRSHESEPQPESSAVKSKEKHA